MDGPAYHKLYDALYKARPRLRARISPRPVMMDEQVPFVTIERRTSTAILDKDGLQTALKGAGILALDVTDTSGSSTLDSVDIKLFPVHQNARSVTFADISIESVQRMVEASLAATAVEPSS